MNDINQLQEFQITVNLGDLGNIVQALHYIQYGTAAPLIEKIQTQVAAQTAPVTVVKGIEAEPAPTKNGE